jgi:hypothetical protein
VSLNIPCAPFNPDTWLDGDIDNEDIPWERCSGQHFFAFGLWEQDQPTNQHTNTSERPYGHPARLEILHFYGTRRFINVCIRTCHWSQLLCQMNFVNTLTSHFSNMYLKLSSLVRLYIPSGLFPSGVRLKLCVHFPSTPHAICVMSTEHSLIWILH